MIASPAGLRAAGALRPAIIDGLMSVKALKKRDCTWPWAILLVKLAITATNSLGLNLRGRSTLSLFTRLQACKECLRLTVRERIPRSIV